MMTGRGSWPKFGVPSTAQAPMEALLRKVGDNIEDVPCVQDPDLWWSHDRNEIEHAKRMCHNCPAINECLRYALEAKERVGIWGGAEVAVLERNRVLARKRENSARSRLIRQRERNGDVD